jgi:dihydroorotate dehydrogenase (NAD+) catalytic subunit
MKPNLEVKIGKLKLKNPVMAASGTFGYGVEFEDIADIKNLGAIVTKTITLHARVGNKPPRIIETPSGMLNSIGLENPGIDKFIKDKLPALRKFKIPIVASIAGERVDEYKKLAQKLDKVKEIAAVEINISCPNIKTSKLFAQSEKATEEVVKAVRSATDKTVITKLSPNVTDVASIAKAAESAGSDALSLINTVRAMAVDIEKRESKLGNITGGLSGPAIKPIALFIIRRVYHRVGIPIIGTGGIMDWKDAIEFILCGSTAVAVGTANFVNPNAGADIVSGLKDYLQKKKINDITNLIGSLRT